MLTIAAPEFVRPRTLAELMAHLKEHAAESLIVAGGTDAVPNSLGCSSIVTFRVTG